METPFSCFKLEGCLFQRETNQLRAKNAFEFDVRNDSEEPRGDDSVCEITSRVYAAVKAMSHFEIYASRHRTKVRPVNETAQKQ